MKIEFLEMIAKLKKKSMVEVTKNLKIFWDKH
jgi:hypothetical protein